MDERLPPPFAVAGLRDDAGGAVVALRGELDLAWVREAGDAIARALDEAPERLLVDLRELVFVDSSGIRVLLGARDRCEREGVPLFLVRPASAVHRALVVCGLAEHFEIVEDLSWLRDPDAVRAVAEPPREAAGGAR
ncbi:MAG: hypothetical protein QOE28_1042 [Solirubrobacteraceae bacterium]|nr:hypothetical protein [Solirubrobacteraceae bacterium]